MSGAAMNLAKVFGFDFSNGIAVDTCRGFAIPAIFFVEDKTLHESVLIRGSCE